MDNQKKDSVKVYNENHMENCNVIQGDQYGGVFPLPGAHVTINQLFGNGQKPKQEVPEGKAETAEAREKRKSEVMKSITDKFDFSDEQLGCDNNGKKITNERLASLFRKCFGFSHVPPTAERKLIMEQLWVLLIDERNQCPKDVTLGFIPQTVLNIIGYFKQCDLVGGQNRELARVIIKDADANIAKNIARGLESNVFPQGTMDMIDHYIDKLMNGEF